MHAAGAGRESLSAFVQRVETASHQCQLKNMREAMAVHVVIKGLRDEQLKSELLKIADIGMSLVAGVQVTGASRSPRHVRIGYRRLVHANRQHGLDRHARTPVGRHHL